MKFMMLKTRYENLQRIKSYTGPPIVSEMIQNLTEIRPIHIHGKAVPSENYFLLGYYSGKGKAIPLQAWPGPEGSRRLRLPDFKIFST